MIKRYPTAVAEHPQRTILLILAMTALLIAGIGLIEEDDAGLESFLSDDRGPGRALSLLEDRFPLEGRPSTIQVVVRGNVADPTTIAAVIEAIDESANHPDVAPSLDPGQPVVSYAHLISQLAGPGEPLSAASVERALETSPVESPERALLDDLLVADQGETTAAFGFVTQQRGELTAAELNEAAARLDDLLTEREDLPAGVTISTFSQAQFEEAFEDGLADTQLIFPLALALILAVLWLFSRSAADTFIMIGGVLLTVLWFTGAQGWLGPRGLAVIGGTGLVNTIIPVMLVGLTVDYGLQAISRYREELQHAAPRPATARALRSAGTAITLGALTTSVAFATNLVNPLPPLRDFGILAAAGIVSGLVVMTSFVPATRALLDGRRSKMDRKINRRPVAQGISRLSATAADVARLSATRPRRVLAIAALAVGTFGVLALGVSTTFSNTDFLPDDHPATRNLELLREELGGTRSAASILIEGDLTDPSVVTELERLDDQLRAPDRPPTIAGDPIIGHPELSVTATSGRDVALVTLPVRIDRSDLARDLISYIDQAWQHPDAIIETTGDDLLPTIISDQIADSQVTATAITIITALALLVGYFWAANRRWSLGLVAIVPVVGVLAIVIGAMRLLGLVYNPLTAILTSLTIGLGVDYTIHLTHRYVEERRPGTGPPEAAHAAASTTGGALVASATTTFAGFILLTLSPLPAMYELGALTAIIATSSLLLSLTVLPALLALVDKNRAHTDHPTRDAPRDEVLAG